MKRYSKHPDIRLTELEDEGIVLHLGNRRYFTVSETGVTILNALEDERTIQDLVDVLRSTYEVTEEEATSTTKEFLEQCEAAGVVTVSTG